MFQLHPFHQPGITGADELYFRTVGAPDGWAAQHLYRAWDSDAEKWEVSFPAANDASLAIEHAGLSVVQEHEDYYSVEVK